MEETGSISVSAVGALAAAAIIGPRAALVLAITMSAVEWSARRAVFHQLLFNVGALSFASLGAAAVFSVRLDGRVGTGIFVAGGLLAGLVYFVVNMGLVSIAVGVEGRENPLRVFKERFSWLAPHYAVYGFIAAVIYEAYKPIGAWAILVFALPLFLMRKTQEAYLKHTQRSAHKLRAAAETIQSQNVSLEQANKLLKERSTAAMESLSATVDARDAYTAGHSRRVQQLALAIGRELVALARGARAARARRALPRHRQARHPGLDPPEAGEPDRGGVGDHGEPRRGGRVDHQPPRVPQRRRAGDPPPPRALRRPGVSRRPRRARTSRSARGSSTSRTPSTRC